MKKHYYLAGKLMVDTASVMFWGGTAASSAAASNVSNAISLSSATASGFALAGGVTAPAAVVSGDVSFGSTVTSALAKMAAAGASMAAGKSAGNMTSTKGKMDSLPTYHAGNFRKNLEKLVGPPPSQWAKADAHHVFPKKFKANFKNKVDIHDPKYGVWVERSKHRSDAYAYNQEWLFSLLITQMQLLNRS